MADEAADIDRFWKLISEIPVAMVVTHEQGKEMRARPMAMRPAREEGVIDFLTDADAPKAAELWRNAAICLALADIKAQKYVSITGRAELIDNKERVRQIWSVYDKAFWPDADDPRIRVLRVTPESAEYWEESGRIAAAVKLVIATATGERMEVGESRKVEFAPQGGKLAD